MGKFKRLVPWHWLVLALSYVGVILFTAGIVGLSTYSLPGSWLYGVKLGNQGLTHAVTRTASDKIALRMTFSETKMKDIESAFDKNKQIDKALLLSAVDDARAGLEAVPQLPEAEQRPMLEKVYAVTMQLVQILSKLDKIVGDSDKVAVRNALISCMQLREGVGSDNGK